VHALQGALEKAGGVDLVAPFGASLHVCGHDEKALEKAIAAYQERGDIRCEPSAATLEDAFIYLMNTSKDNFDDS